MLLRIPMELLEEVTKSVVAALQPVERTACWLLPLLLGVESLSSLLVTSFSFPGKLSYLRLAHLPQIKSLRTASISDKQIVKQ